MMEEKDERCEGYREGYKSGYRDGFVDGQTLEKNKLERGVNQDYDAETGMHQ